MRPRAHKIELGIGCVIACATLACTGDDFVFALSPPGGDARSMIIVLRDLDRFAAEAVDGNTARLQSGLVELTGFELFAFAYDVPTRRSRNQRDQERVEERRRWVDRSEHGRWFGGVTDLVQRYADCILGVLSCYDRVIVRGRIHPLDYPSGKKALCYLPSLCRIIRRLTDV
jgi:hypothetical protein